MTFFPTASKNLKPEHIVMNPSIPDARKPEWAATMACKLAVTEEVAGNRENLSPSQIRLCIRDTDLQVGGSPPSPPPSNPF